jgi:uncharacterized protein YdbL (DUF1318 family)
VLERLFLGVWACIFLTKSPFKTIYCIGVRQLVDSQTDLCGENFIFNVVGNSSAMIHSECQKCILQSAPKEGLLFRFFATSKFASSILTLSLLPAALQAQTLSQVVNQALQTYPAVLSASARSAAARTDITRARSAHYPQIGVNASANSYASGTLPTGAERTSLSPTAKVNLWSGERV